MAPQTVQLAADTMSPLGEWVHSAGFGGAAAVVAALIVLLALLLLTRRSDRRHQSDMEQRDQQHQETLEAEQRAAAINRCWDRLVWVVQTADMEPAATDPASANMGLGPELAEELLRGLKRDAEELGDDTLAKAVAVYLSQLGLVLAQQTSRLADVASAKAQAKDKPAAHASSSPDRNRATPSPAAPATTAPDNTAEPAAAEGRRRR